MAISNSGLFNLLRFCLCCLFFGKGMDILFGSNSYHLVSNLPFFWELFSGYALLILGCLVALPLTVLRQTKFNFLFLLATIVLVVSSYSKFVKVGYLPEQMIEHSLQFFLPVFGFAVVQRLDRMSNKNWLFALKIVLALTFVGHGLFAIGWHEVPQNFIDMTTVSLHISESQAISFLFIMGILDFIIAALIFIPVAKIHKWALWYMVAWGLITAFARMYWQIDQIGTADFWTHNFPNTIFRLPNGLMPLFLIWALFKNNVNSLR